MLGQETVERRPGNGLGATALDGIWEGPFVVAGVRLTRIDGAARQQRPPRRSRRAGFQAVALEQNRTRWIALKYELNGARLRAAEHQRPGESDSAQRGR